MFKKPLGYTGHAFDDPAAGYNEEYLKTKKYKKEEKKILKQNKRYQQELKTNGYDVTETWNLDYTIAAFILPRLKLFRKSTIGYPSNLTQKKWNKHLDKMIIAFELYTDDDWSFDDEKTKKINKGLDLFRKYFMSLWN